jgi:hypothetical protein
MIRVECPNCHKVLESPDEYAGRSAKCGGCGALIPLVESIAPLVDSNPKNPLGIPVSKEVPPQSAPRTADEMLASIDKTLADINYYVGCMFQVLVASVILGIIGALLSLAK